MNRYIKIRFADVHELVSTQSFVGLIKVNSKSRRRTGHLEPWMKLLSDARHRLSFSAPELHKRITGQPAYIYIYAPLGAVPALSWWGGGCLSGVDIILILTTSVRPVISVAPPHLYRPRVKDQQVTHRHRQKTKPPTHTQDKKKTKPPNEHPPQTLNNARRWRDDGACHIPRPDGWPRRIQRGRYRPRVNVNRTEPDSIDARPFPLCGVSCRACLKHLSR